MFIHFQVFSSRSGMKGAMFQRPSRRACRGAFCSAGGMWDVWHKMGETMKTSTLPRMMGLWWFMYDQIMITYINSMIILVFLFYTGFIYCYFISAKFIRSKNLFSSAQRASSKIKEMYWEQLMLGKCIPRRILDITRRKCSLEIL